MVSGKNEKRVHETRRTKITSINSLLRVLVALSGTGDDINISSSVILLEAPRLQAYVETPCVCVFSLAVS